MAGNTVLNYALIEGHTLQLSTHCKHAQVIYHVDLQSQVTDVSYTAFIYAGTRLCWH